MVDVGRTKARRDGEDGGFGARKGWSTGSGDIDPVAGGRKVLDPCIRDGFQWKSFETRSMTPCVSMLGDR